MKFWAAALMALAIGWAAPANAAISGECRLVADAANTSSLQARGGFASLFETRAAPADERERQQRVVDAADAALMIEATKVACAGADNAAPLAALTRDSAPLLQAVTAALAADECLPVLAAVQARLMGLAEALESGSATPQVGHVLTGAMALDAQAAAQCKGEGAAIAAKFAEQGQALRGLYGTVAVCTPAQFRYHQSLERAAGMAATATREVYDAFMRETYEPALTGVRTACGDLLKAEIIDANDKKLRDFDALKAEAVRALQQQQAPQPPPAAEPVAR